MAELAGCGEGGRPRSEVQCHLGAEDDVGDDATHAFRRRVHPGNHASLSRLPVTKLLQRAKEDALRREGM